MQHENKVLVVVSVLAILVTSFGLPTVLKPIVHPYFHGFLKPMWLMPAVTVFIVLFILCLYLGVQQTLDSPQYKG